MTTDKQIVDAVRDEIEFLGIDTAMKMTDMQILIQADSTLRGFGNRTPELHTLARAVAEDIAFKRFR